MHRLDARAHRGGDDESREEQRDDELQLPEREREYDDADDDQCGDGGLASGLSHGTSTRELRFPTRQTVRRAGPNYNLNTVC